MKPSASDHSKLVTKYVTVNHMKMHVLASEHPTTKTLSIILIHGLAVSSRYMIPFAELLSPDYTVYAPDFPGFGKSDNPKNVLSLSELADAVVECLDGLRVKKAIFIGNSLGCQVIADIAVRHPDYIDKIVFIGPTIDRYRRTMRQQIFYFIIDTFYEAPSQALLIIEDYFDCGSRRLFGTLRFALNDIIEEKLPHIKNPVLVLRGEHDRIISQQWLDYFASRLPNCTAAVVPGAAHAINYMAPEKLLTIVKPFIDSPSIKEK